jgi:amidase
MSPAEDDYMSCDATELARRVATREVSPLELVTTAIALIERCNPQLNAVVHRMYDSARARAAAAPPQGALRGVPMVLKDFDGFVRDEPFTASSRFLDGYCPDHDSEAIARLRRAGLVFVAKTSCPELGILGTTDPAWRGPTRNPYDLTRSAGGSSGGSAALVAARAVPIGHGGDGGGSLRIPASHCGLVGFKATRGRVPLGPDWGEGWGGYVQWGALTRSVRDAAAMLDVMAGPMPGDPYAAPALPGPLAAEVGRDPGRLRIGLHAGTLFGDRVDDANARAVLEAGRLLEGLGHSVEQAKPEIDRDELVRAYFTEVAVGIATEIDDFAHMSGRSPRASLFEPGTWFLAQSGRALPALELQRARDAIRRAGRVAGAFHERYDLFLCPTVTHPPVRIGELALDLLERVGLAALRALPVGAMLRQVLRQFGRFLEPTPNTQLFNQTGQPAISLPTGEHPGGLPIGVQLVAALGREDLLVRVASQIEAAAPWSHRRPARA